MIEAGSKFTIKRIPLDCIQVKEYQRRYPDRLMHYIKLLKEHPGKDPGILFVVPSDTHERMYALLDGHHKFLASIMDGRSDALCVVIEEPPC